ncbi:MAG: CBS domain-containing protein [Betaproteobacteria bacterium]|nr:CBS domain-containing protein [Betaproteobacteria bacterium]
MKTLQQVLDAKKIHNIISVSPDQLVYDALVVLAENRIGAVLVMEGEKLAGIFSERDYAREVRLKGRSSESTKIREVMTTKMIIASPHDTVDFAMSLLSEKRIRHLPILENDKLVGLLSIGDLVKETIEYQQFLIKQLENYIQG